MKRVLVAGEINERSDLTTSLDCGFDPSNFG